MRQEIRRYLLEEEKNDCAVTVIVDDAQELDFDSLKQLKPLLRLRSSGRNLLQIVLVGHPELETTLAHPTHKFLKQRVALWARLTPLALDEVAAYIQQRLSCEDQRVESLFEPTAIDRIAAYSQGIPGLINTICDKALYLAYTRSQKPVMAGDVDEAWEILSKARAHFGDAQLATETWFRSRLDLELPQSTIADFTVHAARRDWEPVNAENDTSGLKEPVKHRLSAHMKTFRERFGGLFFFCGEAILQCWRKIGDFIENSLNHLYAVFEIRRLHKLIYAQRRGFPLVLTIAALVAGVGILYGEAKKSPVRSYPTATLLDQKKQHPGAGVELDVTERAEMLQQAQIPQQVSEQEPVKEPSAGKMDRKRPTNGSTAVVYVHTSKKGDLPLLEEIQTVLRTNGYAVRDTRLTLNRTQGDVRFFFNEDRQAAESIRAVVQAELQKRRYPMSLQLLKRDGKRFKFASPGKIEVWLPPLPESAPAANR